MHVARFVAHVRICAQHFHDEHAALKADPVFEEGNEGIRADQVFCAYPGLGQRDSHLPEAEVSALIGPLGTGKTGF